MKPIDTIYFVAFATFIALGILYFYFTTKKKSTWIVVGRYGALVWITGTFLRILLKYIHRFHFSSWYTSLEKNYQEFLTFEWKWKIHMEYLVSMVLLLPMFIVFCLFLFYLTKSSKLLKSTLSILVIFFCITSIISIGEPSLKYWTETEIFFVTRSGLLLFCIWIYQIDFLEEPSKDIN